MKIVLLYPAWTGEYGLIGHFGKRLAWPPLNLALLAACCRNAGHTVEIIDGESMGYRTEELARRALALNPDVVGLSAYSPYFHLSADVAAEVKKQRPEQCVIVGGPHVTIMKEKILEENPQFDYAFMGECERTLVQFLDSHGTGADGFIPQGVFYRDGANGKVTCGTTAPFIGGETRKGTDVGKEYPLDAFPLPARDLLPMKNYMIGTKHGRVHFSSIQSMRGCPWTCQFCASEALNTTRMVMRSPQSVVAEMVDTVEKFPWVTHFHFVDDVLTLWADKHILKIVELMDQAGLKVTFEGNARANQVDDAMMKRLAASGLVRLCFGLETVDPKMRETMQKKVPLSAYKEANRICNKYGVEATNSCMIGLAGETRQTAEMLIEFLENARDVYQANFAIAVPYPGTEFYDMAAAGSHGLTLLDKDFAKYLRYGKAVTKVGDLEPQDLIDLQNEFFVRFYSKPFRWPAMYRKHGTMGFVLTLMRVWKLWQRRLRGKSRPFELHPGVPK